MRTRLAYLGAWLLGTVLAIAVTTAAVGLVRNEVTDGPTVSTIAMPGSSTSTTAASTTSAPPTTTTTSVPPSSSTTTTEPPATTTTRAPTTSTTAPPSTTTSTTEPAFVRTYTLVGGAVTIRAADPDVTLVAATPSAGFTVKVGKAGPDEVTVEFESSDHESEFKAKWEDDGLVIETDESDD